jgi:aspartate/methionine/tyrosine aminotransferase
MWVNYPHMPTGTPPDPAFFAELIAFAQAHEILVVNDNPYAFVGSEHPQSLLAVPGAKAVALELNSLSKAHNMAGWRIGMVAGATSYIQTILRFKSNMDSGMFKPLQLAAVTALALPTEWYQGQNAIYAERRQLAEQLLRSLGCTIAAGQVGMFVWAKVPARYRDSYELADTILAEKHVFLTPGGIFGPAGEQYIRISLCSSVDTIRKAQKRLDA